MSAVESRESRDWRDCADQLEFLSSLQRMLKVEDWQAERGELNRSSSACPSARPREKFPREHTKRKFLGMVTHVETHASLSTGLFGNLLRQRVASLFLSAIGTLTTGIEDSNSSRFAKQSQV